MHIFGSFFIRSWEIDSSTPVIRRKFTDGTRSAQNNIYPGMPPVLGAGSCIIALVVIGHPICCCYYSVPFGVGRVSLACDFPNYFFPALQGQWEYVVSPHLLAEGGYPPEGPGFLLRHMTTALLQMVWGKAWHRCSSLSTLKCSPQGGSKALGHAGCSAAVRIIES